MQFIYGTHCMINYSISLSLTPKRLYIFISSYTLLKLLSRQNQHPLLTSFCSFECGPSWYACVGILLVLKQLWYGCWKMKKM